MCNRCQLDGICEHTASSSEATRICFISGEGAATSSLTAAQIAAAAVSREAKADRPCAPLLPLPSHSPLLLRPTRRGSIDAEASFLADEASCSLDPESTPRA